MATRTTNGGESPSLGERVSRIGKRFVLPIAVVGLGYWGAAQHFGWGSYQQSQAEKDAELQRLFTKNYSNVVSEALVRSNGAGPLEMYVTEVVAEDASGESQSYRIQLGLDRQSNRLFHVNPEGRWVEHKASVNLRLTDEEGNYRGRLPVSDRQLAGILLKQ